MDGGGDLHTGTTTFIRVISLSIAFYESVANHLLCRTTPDLVCPQLPPHPPGRMEILQEPAVLEAQSRLLALHRHPVRPIPHSHTPAPFLIAARAAAIRPADTPASRS